MSDSEEEYGPLASTWGDQAKESPPKGWDALLDPNIKIGPNDLGSGNLHRKGKNFKPIDEELILAQRKHIQVPKKKMQEAIRKTEQALGLPESTRSNGTKKKPMNKKSTLPKQTKSAVFSTLRAPPPNPSNWSQSVLVDTPFWEQSEKTMPRQENKKEEKQSSWASTMAEINADSNWGALGSVISKKTPQETPKETKEETDSWNNNHWGTETSWNASTGWNDTATTNTTTATNTTTTTTTITTLNDNTNNNNIPSDRPSWLNSIPNQDADSKSRFSNPSKQRYSDYSAPELPKPVNYQGSRRPMIPTETAPPPPPQNSLLVTVNVELSASLKVPVPIRELDEPEKLAQAFGEKYNVNRPNVIAALSKLFSSQKELAVKKKQQKLQRRVPNYPKSPTLSNNVYNSYQSSLYSTYSTQYRPQPAPTRSSFQYY